MSDFALTPRYETYEMSLRDAELRARAGQLGVVMAIGAYTIIRVDAGNRLVICVPVQVTKEDKQKLEDLIYGLAGEVEAMSDRTTRATTYTVTFS